MENRNILDEIAEIKDALPRQQKMLCEYILNRPIEASALTINELAEKAGVGTTTVIRLVNALGFDKFSQLKSRLRNDVLVYWSNTKNDPKFQSDLVSRVDYCADAIRSLKRPDFLMRITSGAELLLKAKRVFVYGARMSEGTSAIMAGILRNYSIDVRFLSREAEYLFDSICEMDEEDLFVCFASSPAILSAADALKLCRSMGIKTMVISGSVSSDLADKATLLIDTGVSRRPATIPATIMAVELLSVELARLLDENGRGYQKNHLNKMEALVARNGIKIWE